MKNLKLMPLFIQMFADEEGTADNADTMIVPDDVDADVEIEDVEFADGPSAQEQDVKDTKNKDKTKAYSERLNADRAKIKAELEAENKAKLDAIAQGRGFDTWDELEEYSNKQALEDLGVTDSDAFEKYIDNLISKNPKIIEANRILEEQAQRDRDAQIEREIEKIHELDESIKTVEDLLASPNYDSVLEKVKQGVTLLDAYRLANFDSIVGRASDKASQKTYENVANKSHIKTATGRAVNDIVVPNDVLSIYKKNMPNWTEEQIKKHYANSMKGDN